ncbi:MAG: hypothetical protein OQL19_10010 [Gammaproteobacteria bacterium]|nr:hypothetical protein [Gammaproteobacteria bacterium]
MPDSRQTLAIFSILTFSIMAILPILFLVATVFFNHFLAPTNISFTELQLLFLNSFFFSSNVTFFTLFLGMGLAWIFTRTTLRHSFIWLGLFCLPLFIPINILANIWSHFLGNHTGLNALLLKWLPSTEPLLNFSPWFSASLVQIMSFYPISLLIFYAAFLRWEQHWSEACYFSSYYKKLHRIVLWRYYRNYLGISALLIFVFSFSDFAVADMFQLHVYATEVFLQLSAYSNLSGALILSLPIILMGIIYLFFIYHWLEHIPLSNGYGNNRQITLKILSPVQTTTLYLLFLFLIGMIIVLPISYLLITIDSWTNMGQLIQLVWQDIILSLFLSFIATTICLLLSLALAYSISRKLKPMGIWIRLFLLFLFILPSSLIGIAYIHFWNQPYFPDFIYQQGWILPFALSLIFLPIAVEIFLLQFKKLPIVEEQAAHLCGISFYKSLRLAILLRLTPVIKIVSLICFIFCFNELTISLLISPPGLSILPVRLFSMVHYGSQSLIASLSLLQLLVLIIPVFFLYRYNLSLIKKSQEKKGL